MNTTDPVELYHVYYFDQLAHDQEPLGFEDWVEIVFKPFLAGRELVMTEN